MQTIYLDISNKGVVPTVYAKQGDVGRKFEVVLTDSGLPYIPTNGSVFSVWYSGASGEGNYTDIGGKSAFSVNGNKVIVEIITQMISNDGEGILSIVLNDIIGNQIGTWNIRYVCESVPGTESEGAKEYYTAFSEAVKKLSDTNAILKSKLSVDGTTPMTGDLQMGNHRVTGVGAPEADGDAVNRKYVQDNFRGSKWMPTAADVGAAPAGFGYGESMPLLNYASKDELLAALDELLLSMPYDSSKQIAIASSGLLGYTYTFYCTLTRCWTGYSTLEGFSYDGARFDMYQMGGTWSDVRWINPSMTVGVEYCTHERYNGLPVYSKVVSVPSLPNNGTATISHGIHCTQMLRRSGKTSAGDTLPYSGWGAYINVMANLGSIIIESNFDASALTAEVQLWYTKG